MYSSYKSHIMSSHLDSEQSELWLEYLENNILATFEPVTVLSWNWPNLKNFSLAEKITSK